MMTYGFFYFLTVDFCLSSGQCLPVTDGTVSLELSLKSLGGYTSKNIL